MQYMMKGKRGVTDNRQSKKFSTGIRTKYRSSKLEKEEETVTRKINCW